MGRGDRIAASESLRRFEVSQFRLCRRNDPLTFWDSFSGQYLGLDLPLAPRGRLELLLVHPLQKLLKLCFPQLDLFEQLLL